MRRALWCLLGGGFVIALVSVLVWQLFFVPVPQAIHLTARPDWVRLVTDTVALQEVASTPWLQHEGAYGRVEGSFRSLFLVSEMKTRISEVVILRRHEKDLHVALEEPLPADLHLAQAEGAEPCKLFVEYESPRREAQRWPWPDQEAARPTSASSLPKVSDGSHPIQFRVPDGRTLDVKFVAAQVDRQCLLTLPEALTRFTSYPAERFAPDEELVSTGARTFAVRVEPPSDNQGPNVPLSVDLFASEMKIGVVNGSLSVGSKEIPTRDSDLIRLRRPLATRLTLQPNPICPFTFAATLSSAAAGARPWLMVTGGGRSVALGGPTASASIGATYWEMKKTDVLEMRGPVQYTLELVSGGAPLLDVHGRPTSVKRNDVQMLPTRWGTLGSGVQGGIAGGLIGGIMGFLASLAVRYLTGGNRSTPRK